MKTIHDCVILSFSMKNKILITLVILWALSFGLDGAQMHAFFVCDTDAYQIGCSVGQNMENMRNEMQKAAATAELELIEYLYSGKEANSKFLEKLDEMRIEHDDVVLFYWAGHGYRTSSKESPWPTFSFANEWKGVDFEYVNQQLIQKRPRLLLSIADTCNNVLPERATPPLAHNAVRAGLYLQVDVTSLNYQSLFRDSDGAYLASSSTAGQYSWYKTSGGGYFTNAFIQALQEELDGLEETNWLIVFQKASEDPSFEKLPEIQTPQYQHITFR